MLRLITFYLPQFHPIPENDAWWGKGFTEWTNVAKARPWFKDHLQPQLPADLGFYDLRVDEVREEQARLASRYGISGFCYYYYWFNGRRLLERPLEAMLATGKPDFPFCICWANESWTRRWDGSEHDVLMEQVHSPDSDRQFIQDIIPILKDPRYIRVAGAPILLVYRFSLMPDPISATETWREACREAGIERLHIAAVQSFGIQDPRLFGCDSAVEFPPHGVSAREISGDVEDLDPAFKGKIYDYRDLIASDEMRAKTPYPVFPTVMPSWDNTARRGATGHVFHNSSPEAYETWLRNAIARTAAEPVEGERMVFINAWNEWAEGTHLEPDRKWGHAYLEATKRCLSESIGWHATVEALQTSSSSDRAKELLGNLAQHIRALEAANEYLKRQIDPGTFKRQLEAHPMRAGLPKSVIEGDIRPGLMNLEQVNHAAPGVTVRLPRQGQVFVKGWAFMPGLVPLHEGRETYAALIDTRVGTVFSAMLTHWEHRPDVSTAFPSFQATITSDSGFSVVLDLAKVPSGKYQLAFVERGLNRVGLAYAAPAFEIR